MNIAETDGNWFVYCHDCHRPLETYIRSKKEAERIELAHLQKTRSYEYPLGHRTYIGYNLDIPRTSSWAAIDKATCDIMHVHDQVILGLKQIKCAICWQEKDDGCDCKTIDIKWAISQYYEKHNLGPDLE